MEKLVSVVIPTYNREQTISHAIDSVLSQSYKNIEIVVVDDCSNDNTELLIKQKYGDIHKVKFYKLSRNSGASAARNKGIEFSEGEYIAFLDSDDAFYPFKIKRQVEELEKTGSDVCVSSHHLLYANKKKIVIDCHPGSQENFYNDLLYGNFITTGTLLGKRKCFEENVFDAHMSYWEDWDLVLRLASQYSFCFVKEPTLLRERQAASLTANATHNKRLSSLQKIYSRNQKGYQKNSHANTQIKWLMGLHSSFLNKNERLHTQYSYLWQGVVGNGFSPKRFLIFLCVFFRIKYICELAC